MKQLNLPQKLDNTLKDFINNLNDIYGDKLISVILYGSAASGEFVKRHSNLNLLVLLRNTDLENLKKVSGLTNKYRFRFIQPLFFTEDYIRSSGDVFPIEFLDMKENYTVLSGKDALKDISIDTRNLRFQCEQELKIKLINLKQMYLRRNKDKAVLSNLLLKSFTSILHILRNVLRIKGKQPPYLKQDILKDITAEFQIEVDRWEKILAAKNKQIKLKGKEIERLFVNFVRDVEKIVNTVDRL